MAVINALPNLKRNVSKLSCTDRARSLFLDDIKYLSKGEEPRQEGEPRKVTARDKYLEEWITLKENEDKDPNEAAATKNDLSFIIQRAAGFFGLTNEEISNKTLLLFHLEYWVAYLTLPGVSTFSRAFKTSHANIRESLATMITKWEKVEISSEKISILSSSKKNEGKTINLNASLPYIT